MKQFHYAQMASVTWIAAVSRRAQNGYNFTLTKTTYMLPEETEKRFSLDYDTSFKTSS